MQTNQTGFSLIEVMISFILIGIASLGLVKLQTYVEQRADFAIHSVEALNLAEQQLEWFRTRGASTALSSISVATYSTDIVTGLDDSDPTYTLSWSVPSATVSGSLKTVKIEASWTDRMGETQKIELSTMVSKFSEFD